MLVVGLTGGIGSGKTAVGKRLEALGVPVIDADAITRQLVEPTQPAYNKIVQIFGHQILEKNGAIDRAKLRRLVFNDPVKRTQLEGLLHPLVRQEMKSRIASLQTPYCVLMIPLLVETGQMDLVDRVLVVDTTRELQILRASVRDGVSEASIEAIAAAQADRETRLSLADDVLENNGDLEELYAKVDALHDRYSSMTSPSPLKNIPVGPRDTFAKTDLHSLPGQISVEAMPWLRNIGDAISRPEIAPNIITYELPLNERVRTLMRLEGLFEEMDHHIAGNTVWDTRSGVRTLMYIINALNRPDIKTELIKESDRLHNTLGKFATVPGVDKERLVSTQQELGQVTKNLRSMNSAFGNQLRQVDLIASIKQRETIPGGPSTFDLPCYGYWLNQPVETRRNDLQQWFSEFDGLRVAVNLILKIVRGSAVPTEKLATNGTFQLIMDTTVTYQLIRVQLSPGAAYCAEISGGRHRFGVRFMSSTRAAERPCQTKDDVTFLLACCAI